MCNYASMLLCGKKSESETYRLPSKIRYYLPTLLFTNLFSLALPKYLLDSLQNAPGFDIASFEKVHNSQEQVTSIRLNPAKPAMPRNIGLDGIQETNPVPWTDHGYYLLQRPSFTFDPFFHAGCYYVQEASSMFLEQAMKQRVDLTASLKVLDLSAAPGGKTTHLQSLLSPGSLLVSNDVIRSRASILKDNIIKWGTSNVVVTNNDPRDFSKMENYFDVIVVDAPCSGSGLFRRDEGAMEEWSINNVQLCSQRQQRILADIWPALKNDGVLIYSTCSYSREEDEDIATWLTSEFKAEQLSLSVDPAWNIVDENNSYRFWPDKVKGEGFFLACFRKLDGDVEQHRAPKNKKLQPIDKKDQPIVDQWINKDGLQCWKHLNTVYAWPENMADDILFLLDRLKVIYSGIQVGELIRDKLVPDHALAMSGRTNAAIACAQLDYDLAILYLKRKEMQLTTLEKGWQLVQYEGQVLGWVNVLQNRINNYYPKDLRILKDR